MGAQNDIQSRIKTLKIIHFALCSGVVLAYIFAGDLITRISNIEIDSSQYMYFIIPVIGIALSYLPYKQQLGKIEKNQPVEQQFAQYQTASLIRWAVLEGFAFVILIATPEVLLAGIPLIFYMVSMMPTEEKYYSDIQKVGL